MCYGRLCLTWLCFLLPLLSRKYRETSGELAKTKRELEEAQAKVQALQEIREADAAAQREAAENAELAEPGSVADGESIIKDELVDIKKEPDDDSMADDSNKDEASTADGVKKEKPDSKKDVKTESNAETKPDPAVLATAAANAAKIKEQKNAEAEVLRDLKAQLK